jgi:hypothetical protein
LTEAAAHLKTSASRPRAVISVIASVGELWLLPRLADLADHAGVQIIEENEDPVDFASRGVDIRITYGAGAYPGNTVEVLFHDRMVPVAAPILAAALDAGALHAGDGLLIHTQWGPTYANPQSWSGWHEALGSPRRPDPGGGLSVDRLGIAATTARIGSGVALLPETLAAADLALDQMPLGAVADAIIVDMHGEATSEKMAMGHHCDGRASLVVGSHTHVPTADTMILNGGTAYQTDAGMCGDYDSVIGMQKEGSLYRFQSQLPGERYQPALGEGSFVEG